jgi:hypothetical protein
MTFIDFKLFQNILGMTLSPTYMNEESMKQKQPATLSGQSADSKTISG